MMHQPTQSGMTLLELMIAVGIYTVLMLAITTSITTVYQFNAYALEQSNEVDNARRGVTQWNRDVKEMTTGEDGNWPLSVMSEHRLGYYSDTDRDDSVEYVEYVLSSTTLRKFTYNPTGSPATYDKTSPDQVEILSEYVQNIDQATSTFAYFDNAGNPLASTSPIINVRYLQMQLIVNIDPVRNPGEFMLRSSLAPRNLKDNL